MVVTLDNHPELLSIFNMKKTTTYKMGTSSSHGSTSGRTHNANLCFKGLGHSVRNQICMRPYDPSWKISQNKVLDAGFQNRDIKALNKIALHSKNSE